MHGQLLNTLFEIAIRNPDQTNIKEGRNKLSKYWLFYKDKYLYYVNDYTMSLLRNH